MTMTLGSSREGFLDVPDTLPLHHGGALDRVRVAWRLAGAERAPVILALGGISAHRTVFSELGHCGWWDAMAGPGRAIDSGRYRILGMDFLGGNGATTGPAPDARSFPSISTYDQAELICRLLDHLDIPVLHGLVGASYGGMVALAFAERHPDRVASLLVISASDRPHPMATAWRCVQRQVLRQALDNGRAEEGVAAARALAMATYRTPLEFERRFRAAPVREQDRFVFPVERYLCARGEKYAQEYRAAAFLCLSESIDLHAVEPERIRVPVTLIGIAEDQLVPLSDMRALRARLAGPAELIELDSLYGHDAFLKEAERLTPLFHTALESAIHE